MWAVRTIVNAKYNEHTEPILKRLKLLKAHDIYRVTAIKFYHKYKNNKLPNFFNGIFDPLNATHTHNTRHRNNRRESPSTISASQSPRFTIPKVIEEIDQSIISKIQTNSLQSIANLAKSSFINQYNDNCNIVNCYICTDVNPRESNSTEF